MIDILETSHMYKHKANNKVISEQIQKRRSGVTRLF